jgi:hypothetical protein
MDFSDLYSGTAISGAASGALAGGMSAGPYGAVAGGLVGGGMGAYANSQKNQATSNQQKSLDQIIANMKAMGASSYDQHISDLQKALAFYGPAQQAWDRLYGTGTGAAQTGQGSWGGTNIPSATNGVMGK